MSCHSKKTGQLEECKDCKVLRSCVTSWNKQIDNEKIDIHDILKNKENDNTNNIDWF